MYSIDTNLNQTYDPGEPTTTSIADDPSTPLFDESGQFEFLGVSAGPALVRQQPTGSFELTRPGPALSLQPTLVSNDSIIDFAELDLLKSFPFGLLKGDVFDVFKGIASLERFLPLALNEIGEMDERGQISIDR